MSNEVKIMKTAIFGGFKKSDVLAYVEQLQTETADIKESLDRKREEALDLKRTIDELEVKVENLTEISKKIEEKENEITELKVKLELTLADNQQFKEKISEYDEKSEKLRRAEKQIGAAYIDARRYSDDIIDGAKAKAKDIGAIASQDIKREASEIEQLLKDVDSISRKFSTSLEQLHKDVYALSTKLNSSASNLLNLHTDLTGIEAHDFDTSAFYDDDDTLNTYNTDDDDE